MKTDRTFSPAPETVWKTALLTLAAPAARPVAPQKSPETVAFDDLDGAVSTHERLLRGLN